MVKVYYKRGDNMKKLSVNIVMTYPVFWSKYQVLRDFIQNFYDAIGYEKWRQSFCYDYKDKKLSMWVNGVTFNYEWLIHIGASTKTNKPKGYAGFFGEGFKIASLCAYRDYSWKVQMMSDNWKIDVTDIDKSIDNTPVKMLAYNLYSVKKIDETRLILNNITPEDYKLFQDTFDSFYSEDNPIMGKLLWKGDNGAVFLRSNNPINERLPVTDDYRRKGAVFCGYQMLGTNPFNLVVCLHNYKKEDRERRSLYSFDVIDIFKAIALQVDADCAMIMLEKMRRYWNTHQRKFIDIDSWNDVVDRLVRNISKSPSTKDRFVKKYQNLLCLDNVCTMAERNRRWQARTWLKHQEEQYIPVKETFSLLGYPTIEEECEKHGGFVLDDDANAFQTRCFKVLEDVCRNVFTGFFELDRIPERKIIVNSYAVYAGMAVIYKKQNQMLNSMGMRIKYDVRKLYLKSVLFTADGYYKALSTYVHEMCHSFGGDSSASFSLALTFAIELLMANKEIVAKGRCKWNQEFENNSNTVNETYSNPDKLNIKDVG